MTGNMIINSAKLHGLDPSLLAAILNNESDFGNSGVSTKDNNPGGITYTGAQGQMQGTPRPQSEGGYYVAFKSLAQGVDAVATALQNRIVTPQNQNTQNSTAVGGQFSDVAAQKVAQLPPAMRVYAQAGPLGVAYIDSSRVPDASKASIQTLSARAGIPFLDATDVSNIKSLGTVFENVSKMNSLLTTELSAGGNIPGIGSFLGGIKDIAKTGLNNVTLGNAFPDLSKFNALRDVAIKAVQALAGGNGSGLRLNTGEIMASTQTLPSSTDSLQNAQVKVNALLSLLNTNLATNFPYTAGNQPGISGGAPAGGGTSQFSIVAPNGKTYAFPDQQSLDAFKAKAGIQ